MADLRSKFIEDYAGGLLNISRQELASTGEVLSQDGLLADASLFVEDGSGVKSGLKLGASICEVVDPTTDEGVVNVRYANRTYSSVRDLKIFSTALASSQAALADASSSSITNLENAFQLLENSLDTLSSKFNSRNDIIDTELKKFGEFATITQRLVNSEEEIAGLDLKIAALRKDINTSISTALVLKGIKPAKFYAYGAVSVAVPLTSSDTRRDAVTSKAVTGLTSANGSGLDVEITVDSEGFVTTVNITAGGSNFLVGDTVTIPDSSIVPVGGGDGLEAPDVILEVVEIASNQTLQRLTDQVTILFAKVNEIVTAFEG
jgi:hypothetical protein